jgi:hypothetical protein
MFAQSMMMPLPGVAPAAAPVTNVTQLAPTADAVRSYLPVPTQTRYSNDGGETFGPRPPAVSHAKTTPSWVVPAAVAGGVALIALTAGRK